MDAKDNDCLEEPRDNAPPPLKPVFVHRHAAQVLYFGAQQLACVSQRLDSKSTCGALPGKSLPLDDEGCPLQSFWK